MNLNEVKDSLERYEKHKIETGSFLRAVLENDLFKAMGRADLESRANLFEIVQYIYSNLRSDCYGDREAVKKWLEK